METTQEIARKLADDTYGWDDAIQRALDAISADPDASIDCFTERVRTKILRELHGWAEATIDDNTEFVHTHSPLLSDEARREIAAKAQIQYRARALRLRAGALEWLKRHPGR